MIVFRIAFKGKGRGPYQSKLKICKKLADKHCGNNWPMTSYYTHRKLEEKGGRVYYGFSSLRELRNWFSDDEIIELYHEGFRISMFKVHKKFVVKSKKQVMFALRQASLVRVLDFNTLCRLV